VRFFLAGCTVAVLLVGSQSPVWGQAGFYLTPSISLAGEFDDNVFVTASRTRSDFITRFTPGLELAYRSEPLTLLARSSFDAEVFADNTQLDDAAARKRANLEFRYLPDRRLTLSLDASYIDTTTPTGLAGAVGLQFARRNATELVVTPAAAYQFTTVDTGKLRYYFARDTIEDGVTHLTHHIQPSFSHQFTPVDTGLIGYRASVFETEDFRTVTSHTPTVGWIRQLTPLTLLTLEAGPRFIDDGSVQPEAHARLEHTFKLAKMAIDYLRTEAVVLGEAGPVEMEAITGSVEMEPMKLLKIKIEPGYTRTFGGVLGKISGTRAYGIAATAAYPVTAWLTVRLAYRFAYQEETGPSLHHNLVTLSVEAGYPIRIAE
jgi:hypothetical protein